MSGTLILAIAAFGSVSSLIALVYLLSGSRTPQIDTRLADVSQRPAERKPAMPAAIEFLSNLGKKVMPDQEGKRDRTRASLLQAGFYRQYASPTFYGLRFLLVIPPILVGMVLAALDVLPQSALLAVLRHPDPPPLFVIEEIENGLDPRTVHLVVEEIRAAIETRKTQVILTTHSPYLLDLLDLSHIVVVEREAGQPVFRRPDAAKLASWSKSFAPGRLYTMGRLTRGDRK